MGLEEINIDQYGEYSNEIKTILHKTIDQVISNGIKGDPHNAVSYYLIDELTDKEDPILEYIEKWENSKASEYPTGGDQNLYYLVKLHDKYSGKSLSEIVKRKGIVEQFRREQVQGGRIRVDHSLSHHGLTFRGLVAIAPESDAARDAIDNIVFRFNSGRSNTVNDRVSPGSALGLLEHDYSKYRSIIDEVSEQVKENLEDSWHNDREGLKYWGFQHTLLLEKNPSYDTNYTDKLAEYRYTKLIEEEKDSEFTLSFNPTIGIELLATGHGPSKSAFRLDWTAELKNQEKKRDQPKFVSTEPATAVERRQTTIHERIKRMIDQTQNSLYISTLRIGMLHHDLLDLIEEEDDLDLRILTNTGTADGPRKKVKRATMNDLVKKTEGDVKESPLIHTRMVISDEERLLVSSADLTRDQLHDEFNAGLYTEHSESVKQAAAMFNNAWDSAEHRDVR